MEFLQKIDTGLFLFFNRDIANPLFDLFFTQVTHFQFWIIPMVVAAIFFIRKEKKRAFLLLGLALVTVAISDPVSHRILKPLFGRSRPCHPEFFIEGGRFLLGMRRSLSFPSTHSMNMFSQAALFASFYPRRWYYFYLFAVMIGFSRIYTGVHYPIDVIGGAVFGFVVGNAVYFSYRMVYNRLHSRRMGTVGSTVDH